MGIIKRGILGGFSNKVANVVGSSWKGIAVIKSLPLSVANPRTTGQVAQRSKFSAAAKLGSALLGAIVKPLWDGLAQQESGFNVFVRTNLPAFDNLGVPDYSALQISKGILRGVVVTGTAVATATNLFRFNFDDNTGEGNALGTDQAKVAAYNETTGEWAFTTSNLVRGDGESNAVFEQGITNGDVIRAYLYFTRPDGSIISNSQYATLTAA